MKTLILISRRKNLVIGSIVTAVMVIMALFAPLISPHDPIYDADLMVAEEPPSTSYIFGTDDQGRDIFSRVVYGARISLAVGLISQLMNSIIGITLGLIAGYFGKWIDDLIMGLTNIMLSIPSIIFALAIMALLGPGLINVFIALGFTNWSYTCRITRSQTLYTKNLNYVNATDNSLTEIVVWDTNNTPPVFLYDAGVTIREP